MKVTYPSISITNPEFKYFNSAQTDVTRTWAKFNQEKINERLPEAQRSTSEVSPVSAQKIRTQ